MRDLLPPLVLLVGLAVCADARAEEPPDCAKDPIACEAGWAICETSWRKSIETSNTFKAERDNARESLAAEQQARIAAEVEARAQVQARRLERRVLLVAGGVAVAAGAAGGFAAGWRLAR